jgi:hypothetical protein
METLVKHPLQGLGTLSFVSYGDVSPLKKMRCFTPGTLKPGFYLILFYKILPTYNVPFRKTPAGRHSVCMLVEHVLIVVNAELGREVSLWKKASR